MTIDDIKNAVKKELSELRDAVFVNEETAKKRIVICESCPSDQFKVLSRRCKQCGCFMDVKTKLKSIPDPIGDGIIRCPKGHW